MLDLCGDGAVGPPAVVVRGVLDPQLFLDPQNVLVGELP
jgi:hypothetical protein